MERHGNPLVIPIDSKEQKTTDENQGARVIMMMDLTLTVYGSCSGIIETPAINRLLNKLQIVFVVVL